MAVGSDADGSGGWHGQQGGADGEAAGVADEGVPEAGLVAPAMVGAQPW